MTFREENRGGVVLELAPNIGTKHAFTTRYGGVSQGIWSSLNLGTTRGDVPEHVDKNYDLLCAAVEIRRERMCFTRQVHGTVVRPVTAADCHRLFTPIPYEADGLITNETELPLICFAADCVPILLWEPQAPAIGAVHAGWKGTAGDIAGHAVAEMARLYGADPRKVQAAIGPCIGFCCYETGPEVPQAMLAQLGPEAEAFIRPKGDKFHVDLAGMNRALLMRAGVPAENIAVSDGCTMCLPERYWSHRVTRGQRGVQAAVIAL